MAFLCPICNSTQVISKRAYDAMECLVCGKVFRKGKVLPKLAKPGDTIKILEDIPDLRADVQKYLGVLVRVKSVEDDCYYIEELDGKTIPYRWKYDQFE